VNQYREGKVKSTAASRVKQNLKPYAYKQSKGYSGTVRRGNPVVRRAA